MPRKFQAGDRVVYTKQKVSTSPGKRAAEVTPATKGDTYTYVVDKYWVVADVLEDGRVRLKTRRGKEHTIPGDDPLLRPATWWEKIVYASRFKAAGQTDGPLD